MDLNSKLPLDADKYIEIEALKDQIRKVNASLIELIVRLNDLVRELPNE